MSPGKMINELAMDFSKSQIQNLMRGNEKTINSTFSNEDLSSNRATMNRSLDPHDIQFVSTSVDFNNLRQKNLGYLNQFEPNMVKGVPPMLLEPSDLKSMLNINKLQNKTVFSSKNDLGFKQGWPKQNSSSKMNHIATAQTLQSPKQQQSRQTPKKLPFLNGSSAIKSGT